MLLIKIIKLIGVVIIIALIAFVIIGYINQRPMSKDEAVIHLKGYFEKAAKPGKDFSGIQVLINSKVKGIDEQFAFGQATSEPDKKLNPNHPFHIASIGKIFTATLLAVLEEEGKLKLSDPVSKYLEEKQLEGLFVYKGVDYHKEVTIEQLMANTSGIADYFADQLKDTVKNGKTIAELIISEPDKLWTPESLLDFNRNNLNAVGKPGEVYHYSDSGYILLGLLVEKIEMKPFHQVLKQRIFVPLKMNDTYMALRSKPENQPKKQIADIWFKGVEVSNFNSLSVDWAGGGIISTPKDLLTFQKALHSERIINSESLKVLFNIQNKFQSGIHYGLGTMEIRFEEFFPLLRGMPRVIGHIGVLSTHMFYDKATETYIIMNFGSDAKMVDSFKALIEVINTLKRIKN
jgi:D-alanyl-D-alanine carboxypeptidase